MKYGLLGRKLSHSISPVIHRIILKSLNIDATYDLLECEEEQLESYIQALKNLEFQGFNVTIPYKKVIMKYLDEITPKAQAIGSVNTIYYEDGKVIGTNTDYDGFYQQLLYHQVQVMHKNCYILGTGGASLAVQKVLEDMGGKVYCVSRTPSLKTIGYEELSKREIDVLVNTTPVGMFPEVGISPVSKEIAQRAKVVIDIIFNPRTTKLLEDAHSQMNGLYMLVGQALKAEEIWNKKALSITATEIIEKL